MKNLFSLLFFVILSTVLFAGTKPESGSLDVGAKIELSTTELAVTPAEIPATILGDKIPFGFRSAVTLTMSPTITINPKGATVFYAKVTVNATVNFVTINTRQMVGDIIYVDVTSASNTSSPPIYSANIAGVLFRADFKRQIITLVYDGMRYVVTSINIVINPQVT